MFLKNMTDKEFFDQFEKEHQELKRRAYCYWKREGRRQVLKAGKFPAVKVFETKTNLGNTYIMTLRAATKHNFKNNIINLSYTVIVENDVEPMIINFSTRSNDVIVARFYSHFFRRYRERMNLTGSIKDLVKRYITYNSIAQYTFLERDEVGQHFYLSSDEGLSIGVITPEGQHLIKTFIAMNTLSDAKFFKHAKALKKLQVAKEALYGHMSEPFRKVG